MSVYEQQTTRAHRNAVGRARGHSAALWTLAVVVVIGFGVAIGAGIGWLQVGLPGQADDSGANSSASAAEGDLSLDADTTTAAAYERVRLSGTAPAGAQLQVQRLENSDWVRFPTSASAGQDGSFTTYVELGRPGDNQLRVVAPDGSASDPVTIAIS